MEHLPGQVHTGRPHLPVATKTLKRHAKLTTPRLYTPPPSRQGTHATENGEPGTSQPSSLNPTRSAQPMPEVAIPEYPRVSHALPSPSWPLLP
ncbi:hypothetical protein E2C01_067171 [Portunus trituberculatus]|uniref:Uncharacterized protein n=1 Tax=Portunus trituberculatus TaxID=210409 RepID=A0A5B7HUB3_PORTR|nr:hypothetical protein [Portunus trituberculatus]